MVFYYSWEFLQKTHIIWERSCNDFIFPNYYFFKFAVNFLYSSFFLSRHTTITHMYVSMSFCHWWCREREYNFGRQINYWWSLYPLWWPSSPILPTAENCRFILKQNLEKYKTLIFYQKDTFPIFLTILLFINGCYWVLVLESFGFILENLLNYQSEN